MDGCDSDLENYVQSQYSNNFHDFPESPAPFQTSEFKQKHQKKLRHNDKNNESLSNWKENTSSQVLSTKEFYKFKTKDATPLKDRRSKFLKKGVTIKESKYEKSSPQKSASLTLTANRVSAK